MKIPTMRNEGSIQALHEFCTWLCGEDPLIRNKTLIEVGTFYGDSAIVFSKYFKYVITIDPYDSSVGGIAGSLNMEVLYNKTQQRLSFYPNITLIRDFSDSYALSTVDESVDAVYIDGLHTYEGVKNDLLAWLPKMKRDGWLLGHDYRPGKFDGVVRAVNEFRKPDKRFRDFSFAIKLKGGK